MPGRPVRTETIVRTFDAAGVLLSEVTTVVTQTSPPTSTDPSVGMYL